RRSSACAISTTFRIRTSRTRSTSPPARRPRPCTRPAAASKSPSASRRRGSIMNDDMRNPAERPARDELPARLRAAVEQVHAQPLPFGAISDAMERAKRLEGTPVAQTRNHGWRQMAMAAAVLAAALLGPMLVAIAFQQRIQSDKDASLQASGGWD